MIDDTIAAIATGMSTAGIGKVRMSGKDSIEIAARVYQSPKGQGDLRKAKSHTIHYGYIRDHGTVIDEVLVLIMRAPKTYTREDVVEIDCHGGMMVMKKIMETLIHYGARPAEPGEFTKRAFLNGRIDLTQAEAVIDVINAKNDYALQGSITQLRGNMREKISEIRESILTDTAFIEAALDDPEHIQVDGFKEELRQHVAEHLRELRKLMDTAENGRMIKEGIKTVILGKPNAGKSSLLNVLVGDERAIVTEIAGTTRDTLEESITIHGIPLNIIDTAGIHQTEDIVETIGVKKAKTAAQEADLILYVVDGAEELDENDEEILNMIKDRKTIVLLNKMDLYPTTTRQMLAQKTKHPIVEISAKTHEGMEELKSLIQDLFFKGSLSFNDEIYITNVRHKKAIEDTIESLQMVLESIENDMPEDFYTIDLMEAYQKLGEIIGESAGEDLINTIFSDFCMGK